MRHAQDLLIRKESRQAAVNSVAAQNLIYAEVEVTVIRLINKQFGKDWGENAQSGGMTASESSLSLAS